MRPQGHDAARRQIGREFLGKTCSRLLKDSRGQGAGVRGTLPALSITTSIVVPSSLIDSPRGRLDARESENLLVVQARYRQRHGRWDSLGVRGTSAVDRIRGWRQRSSGKRIGSMIAAGSLGQHEMDNTGERHIGDQRVRLEFLRYGTRRGMRGRPYCL